jgi:phospholipase/carboxylesterase
MTTHSKIQSDLSLKYLEYGKPSAAGPVPEHSFRPQTRGKRYLLILLHGRGSNEGDLFDFAPQMDDRFLILSVRAPLELGKIAFAWFMTQYLAAGPIHDVSQAAEAVQTFTRFLGEAQQKYGIPPSRTVLLGFSQGAILGQAIAIQHRELIGGLVALSGRILPEHAVKPSSSERLKDFPVFLSHGEHDEVLKIDYARSSRNILSAFDVDLTYREYPTTHDISDQNFADLKRWLFNWLEYREHERGLLNQP